MKQVSETDSSKSVAVVCSADEGYAMPMAVTLYSALMNLQDKDTKLLVFILDGGIRESTKKKVMSSLSSHRIQIEWIKMNRKDFQHLPLTRHLTQVSYYRLSIGEILPDYVDKVIYLDSDVVVLDDLSRLWQIPVDDHYLLAVQDAGQPIIGKVRGLQNYKNLNLDPEQEYFNGGVLVINLKKWRADQIGLRSLEFLIKNRDTVFDLDQDALNAVVSGRWGKLDPRWNQMPQVFSYSGWQESGYDESTFNLLVNAPHIVHYTNSKPWQLNCWHPRADLFLKYQDQTAWSGERDTQIRRIIRKLKKEMRRHNFFLAFG